MKKDFEQASRKAMLYAEQALVATVGFSPQAPADTAAAFTAYLRKAGVPHEVLFAGTDSVTFATARDPDVDADDSAIRKTVKAFFTGKYADAFSMQGYYQKDGPPDAEIVPFGKVRRAVARKFAA